jgi:hypothetical protein
MPRYRLHRDHFIDGRRRRTGEEVEYGGIPGEFMEPLDDEAWEKHFSYTANRHKRFVFKTPADESGRAKPKVRLAPEKVAIPEDWRGLKGLHLINLAQRLGFKGSPSKDEAMDFIQSVEITRASAVE